MAKIKSMVRLRANIIMAIIVVILMWVIAVICTGCYTPEKAKRQHGKSVATYPEIGADYCARTYPCEPGPARSDTTVVYDTLWGAGEIVIDTITVTVQDTVYRTKIIQFPAKTITRTVHIRDTVQIKDRAELDRCEIERRELSRQNKELQTQLDKKSRQARHRLYAIIGIGAAGLLWLGLFIRRKIVKT